MTRNYGRLAVFILLVLGIGSLIGYATQPGAWFETLTKPAFQPPNWLFGPVWTALYVMIAIAGWRIWDLEPNDGLRAIWIAQLALNFMWSPAFFALENPGLALMVIVPMWITILLFVLRAWPRDRIAGLLFLPYLAWVSFATILNFAIWRLN